MKKLLFPFLCLLSLINYAQSVDEIINRYSTALGGADKLLKIKTMSLQGNMEASGTKFSLSTLIIADQAIRTDITANEQTTTIAFKDNNGWTINPYAEQKKPVPMSKEELISFKKETKIANDLIAFKKRGHQAVLISEEKVDGYPAWKIKLTNKETKDESFYFISKEDSLLIKISAKEKINGQEIEKETYYSDYKMIKGLVFPMRETIKYAGQVSLENTWTKLELDVPVDVNKFNMPGK